MFSYIKEGVFAYTSLIYSESPRDTQMMTKINPGLLPLKIRSAFNFCWPLLPPISAFLCSLTTVVDTLLFIFYYYVVVVFLYSFLAYTTYLCPLNSV